MLDDIFRNHLSGCHKICEYYCANQIGINNDVADP